MRIISGLLASLFVATVAVALASSQAAPTTVVKVPPSYATPGPLAQFMRGVLFPNANIIFDVQQSDPGAPKKAGSGEVGGSTSATFANVYSGWQMVQAAAVALEAAPDDIMKPGRKCENGKPAPIANADLRAAAANLRVVAKKLRVAADKKDRDTMMDLANDLSDACSMCHEVYRDAGDSSSPDRCVAKKKAAAK